MSLKRNLWHEVKKSQGPYVCLWFWSCRKRISYFIQFRKKERKKEEYLNDIISVSRIGNVRPSLFSEIQDKHQNVSVMTDWNMPSMTELRNTRTNNTKWMNLKFLLLSIVRPSLYVRFVLYLIFYVLISLLKHFDFLKGF